MPVHRRLRLLAFPTRTRARGALARHEISRFPLKERPHVPVSQTTPGRAGARDIAPAHVAFRWSNGVGTRNLYPFAAPWLAHALPCRRFAPNLAGGDARLGADADRYSFIVTDFHRLLLAGLPAHCPGYDGHHGVGSGVVVALAYMAVID